MIQRGRSSGSRRRKVRSTMTKNTQHARLCHRIVGRIGPFSTAGHGARPATLKKGPCTGPATPSSSSQPNSANRPISKPLRASRRLGAAGRAASPPGPTSGSHSEGGQMASSGCPTATGGPRRMSDLPSGLPEGPVRCALACCSRLGCRRRARHACEGLVAQQKAIVGPLVEDRAADLVAAGK